MPTQHSFWSPLNGTQALSMFVCGGKPCSWFLGYRALLREQGGMKVELDKLNHSLLERLAASHGDLLSDKALLLSLDETKASAMRITEALQSATDLQACSGAPFTIKHS